MDPLAMKLGGDRLPINLALPWLCTVCVLLDRRGGPAPCGPTNIPTERDLKHHLLLPSRFPTIIWFKEGEFSERFSVLLDSLFSFFL